MIDTSITLTQLQMFVSVVESGSFSAAARQLDRAQSAVSHGIAQLERHLQVELFERGGRTPKLTAAGESMLMDARAVLGQVHQLQDGVASWRQNAPEQTHFSLVVDLVFPVDRLIQLLESLQSRFPNLTLSVHSEARGAVTTRMLAENSQLAISGLLLPEFAHQIETVSLGAIDLVSVVGPTHPLAHHQGLVPLQRLREHTQIVLEDRSHLSTDQQVGVFGANVWRVGDQYTKSRLLQAGFGWGGMPLPQVSEDLRSGKLVRIYPAHWEGRTMEIPLYAIYPASQPLGKVGREALSLLRELR